MSALDFSSNKGDRNDSNDGSGEWSKFLNKPWRPLTRKLKISSAILSPCRLLILVRMVVLGFFLEWRISYPNEDAIWIWLMSLICEIWFAFYWLLDEVPKLAPINRGMDLNVLEENFETPYSSNPTGKSDLPGIDIFVLVKIQRKSLHWLLQFYLYLQLLTRLKNFLVMSLMIEVRFFTFESMAEAVSFANLWVPFCRKHDIEPRNPESYFNMKRDPYRNKVRSDFVKDRRCVKREYDEFKVRTNGLDDSIYSHSDVYIAREEIKALKRQKEVEADEIFEPMKVTKATWMADGNHWHGTWVVSGPEHSRGDHAGNYTEVDIRLPLLVYVSREKYPGYDHNKKAGAMNALVCALAIISNGPFILNLDCDRYIYNSEAIHEGLCFMMYRGGDRICYVQFP